ESRLSFTQLVLRPFYNGDALFVFKLRFPLMRKRSGMKIEPNSHYVVQPIDRSLSLDEQVLHRLPSLEVRHCVHVVVATDGEGHQARVSFVINRGWKDYAVSEIDNDYDISFDAKFLEQLRYLADKAMLARVRSDQKS